MQCSQVIQFTGYVKRDPELRYSGTGNALCSAVLTLYDTVKLQNGDVRNIRSFVPLRAYGLLAETFKSKVRAGMLVTVICKYRTPMFSKPDGQNAIRHHFDIQRFDTLRLPGQSVHDFPETTDELQTGDYATETELDEGEVLS